MDVLVVLPIDLVTFAFANIPGITARCFRNGTSVVEELAMERLVVLTPGWGCR